MDAIRPHCPHDGEFSPGSEDAINNPDDSDAGAATFEAIELAADGGVGRMENETDEDRQNPPRALTAEELNAQHEKIKRLADATLAAPQDRVSDQAAAFFILAVESTHSSTTQLANALHDAFSTPLNAEKTAMLEAFEIAVKNRCSLLSIWHLSPKRISRGPRISLTTTSANWWRGGTLSGWAPPTRSFCWPPAWASSTPPRCGMILQP